jgi:threonine dehydratase
MTESSTEASPPASPETGDRPDALGVGLEDVLAARERIAAYVHRTPLLSSATLSRLTNTSLMLKAEMLQRTGSFKVRGALNAVLQLSPEQRARGVITLSAGNHGQGLAYAAAIAGVRCVVFMAENVVPAKLEAIKGYGAETRFAPAMEGLFAAMDVYREAHGLHFVHPFADRAVLAGQGTVGLELVEDRPDLEVIVAGIGGGGLISGMALAVKALRPEVRLIGVEPEGACVVSQSLAAGRPLLAEKLDTIADGLAAPFTDELPLRIMRRYVDDVVLVSDEEIVAALRLILERAKLLAEPAGATSVAGLLSGKTGVAHGANAIAILSGGNVDREKLKRLL